MVKIDLITGFLGSGKTTFIKKYAKYLMAHGMNIGILENDFGAVNVDMMLLKDLEGDQCELEMVAAFAMEPIGFLGMMLSSVSTRLTLESAAVEDRSAF